MLNNKILIIEDNEQDQKIMRKVLNRAGFERILLADNGTQGVLMATQEQPDIILVDTVLPGIDGFETCLQIKKVNNVNARLIMMTGRVDAVDADRAKMMGADDYCVKTSDFAALVNAVKRMAAYPDGLGAGGIDGPQDVSIPQQGQKSMFDADWGKKKTNEGIRMLYKELEMKTEELRTLDKLKSEFVAMVSHELRTPLALIQGAIGQMIEGVYGEVTDLQREKLNIALRGSKLLKRIIDDLLDFSRLEAREVKLDKSIIDMGEVCRHVFQSFEPVSRQKGIKFSLECPAQPVKVVADASRITQVLTNLVNNAFKFTKEGSVGIFIEPRPEEVICQVQDTGIGIDAQDLPKVFMKFQQFAKKFDPGQEGTGLGLAICKSIIELHRGRIFVDSMKGRGTMFTFILPKHE